ncbi:AzlC family ABC transporter permease [Maritimibacter sp. UBA3975]|uniref:AzlC family ABC transporter permease n=1 Tax=Maritimibacter sp. UBA3975 TaxID=1946833 RepID=UPI000C0A449F|nr:AzlC family ABC transporter permease [Maritimibacter sp. UBA3975]MAM63657.1 branched-chain amino acid transporter AzlC [Maritimibacter sp.]|tara:strand:- start:4969 stop:5676 length:708 start_codon:yes stop_codon:yes gene_type:complete
MSNDKLSFGKGFRDGLPFVFVIVPFGMLFGVVATEAGLDLAQVMVMTVLVIAGASQFAAIQQMGDSAPVFIVLATALAVNLRMAMYSATMAPHLGAAPLWKRAVAAYFLVDQSAVLATAEFEARPKATLAEKFAYFFGVVAPIAPLWYGATWIGAVVGGRIPESFALDFAMPITFLAMIAPMVKTLAHLGAALTSVVVALALAWMPYGTGLLVAAVCAMAVGSFIEVAQARRAAA